MGKQLSIKFKFVVFKYLIWFNVALKTQKMRSTVRGIFLPQIFSIRFCVQRDSINADEFFYNYYSNQFHVTFHWKR